MKPLLSLLESCSRSESQRRDMGGAPRGVARYIAFAEKSNDAFRVYFSTRKLPMIRASMPDEKKVRRASVGV